MAGKHGLFVLGMLGTVIYNALQLTVPVYTGQLVDLFLNGANAAENLAQHRDLFW